jgi:hypothetical protein
MRLFAEQAVCKEGIRFVLGSNLTQLRNALKTFLKRAFIVLTVIGDANNLVRASQLTWKCKMMVQMRPSVSFGLPAIEIVSMKTSSRERAKPTSID